MNKEVSWVVGKEAYLTKGSEQLRISVCDIALCEYNYCAEENKEQLVETKHKAVCSIQPNRYNRFDGKTRGQEKRGKKKMT